MVCIPCGAKSIPDIHKKTPRCIRSPQGHIRICARILEFCSFVVLFDDSVQFFGVLLGFSRYSYSHAESAKLACDLGLHWVKLKTVLEIFHRANLVVLAQIIVADLPVNLG